MNLIYSENVLLGVLSPMAGLGDGVTIIPMPELDAVYEQPKGPRVIIAYSGTMFDESGTLGGIHAQSGTHVFDISIQGKFLRSRNTGVYHLLETAKGILQGHQVQYGKKISVKDITALAREGSFWTYILRVELPFVSVDSDVNTPDIFITGVVT